MCPALTLLPMRPFYPSSSKWWLPVLVLLLTAPSAFAQQPGAKPFRLHLDAYRGSIQWEQSSDRATWANVPNGGVADLTLKPTQTTYYRARITETGCTPTYSDTKAVYVYQGLVLGAKLVQGQIVLPTGSAVNLRDYTVRSLLDQAKPRADGRFEILLADSTAEDLLLVTNPKQEVTLLGNFYGAAPTYTLTAETSAMALLMMYPFLKPLPTSEKGALMAAYRKETAFTQLTDLVAAKIKQEENLYSDAGTNLYPSLMTLIKKGINDSRLGARGSSSDPVEMLDKGGAAFTLRNNTSYSYAGGIYRNSDNNLVLSFLLAGASLTGSPWKYLIGRGDAKSELPLDFSTATLPGGGHYTPGEYHIKLRSGLAFDASNEDGVAIYENGRDLLVSIVDNMFTNYISQPALNKCFNAWLSYCTGRLKIDIKNKLNAGAGNTPDPLADIVLPILSETSLALGSCALSVESNAFLEQVFKQVERYKNGVDAKPAKLFFVEWPLRSKAIDGCKYFYQKGGNSQIVNCFTVAAVSPTLKPTNYVCEELPLQVEVKEDPKYYPNQEKPLPNLDVEWLLTEGGGSFSSGSPFATTPTDAQGLASTTWRLGRTAGNQAAKSSIKTDLTTDVKHLDFATATVVPKPQVFTTGNNQLGNPNQFLLNPLVIGVKDLLDGFPMFIDRFDIKWEVMTGGGTLLPATGTTSDTKITAGRLWKLGSAAGEQTVKATIINKNCDPWQIEGNPVVFTANKSHPLQILKVSGDNQSGEQNKTLPLPLRVRVLDDLGAAKLREWVQFRLGNDYRTQVYAVSDADGYAQTTYGLGSMTTVHQQIIAQLQGTQDQRGDSVIFSATAGPNKFEFGMDLQGGTSSGTSVGTAKCSIPNVLSLTLTTSTGSGASEIQDQYVKPGVYRGTIEWQFGSDANFASITLGATDAHDGRIRGFLSIDGNTTSPDYRVEIDPFSNLYIYFIQSTHGASGTIPFKLTIP